MRFAGLGIIRCAKQDALRSFSEGGPVYYVYLIESLSAQGERYVGMTTDLKQRLREHNQGNLLIPQSSADGSYSLMSRSLIEPRQKLLNVTSNPVQVTHSLESAYGNSLLKVFRVLVSPFSSQSRAASRSSLVRPCPAFAKRIVTSAPALRRSAARHFVSDAGTIGS